MSNLDSVKQSVVEPEYFAKQNVELEAGDGTLKGVYRTQITNLNEAHLLIEVPTKGNLYVPMEQGEALVLRYVQESWSYESKVEVVVRKDDHVPPVMMVNRPKKVTKRLLRQFVRVPVSLDTKLYLLDDLNDYGSADISDKNMISAKIVDISAGGAKIQLPDVSVTTGFGYALLWFTLPVIHKSFYNTLTRIIARPKSDEGEFIIIEFSGLSELERNDILQYCLREQVRQRKAVDAHE